jgi:glycosyltransferase involved in cell wall biosynthesis
VPRIAIAATQIPFARGGAEILVESLHQELLRRGFEVEVVRLPFQWYPRQQLLASALAWRLIDLTEANGKPIDLVIGTRFPSYLVKHPNKVVWLIHQFRQVYDLLGSEYSDFARDGVDREVTAMVHEMDRRTLAECRGLFTISENVAARLARFNGLHATALYPPPKLGPQHRGGPFGDYVFAVGRLDRLKRFDLLVRALPHLDSASGRPVRAVIGGTGPEAEALRQLAVDLGVSDRLELPGFLGDDQLVELYAGALGVYYAPFDEDYGYVTVEAFLSGKPMLTTRDAGGVLEFVADEVNGFVVPPDAPRALAAAIDRLAADRALAARLGVAGRERVREVDWDHVVAALTRTL